MKSEAIPSIEFYDQDFVDLYDRSWVWIDDAWKNADNAGGFTGSYLSYNNQKTYNMFYCCLSSLFLNYSNQVYSPFEMIDYFYSKQEPNGAIRGEYDIETGKPILKKDNPEGVVMPLFAYVEYMFYHKIGNKKRLKEIVPYLEAYINWLRDTFQKENGLFAVPESACLTGNIPRKKTVYPVDFNAIVALNAMYLSEIGDILNDKELSFKYKRLYFSIRTKMNSMMWSSDEKFYFDLNANEEQIPLKLASAYWSMFAEIPNAQEATEMILHLKDPKMFGSENPFPSVSMDSKCFKSAVVGYCGAVVPINTYAIIKGLEKYEEFVFARECAIRHIYYILDTLQPEDETMGDVWEAYLPMSEGIPASTDDNFPAKRFLPQVCLVTIALMIENVIGFDVSLPRKTVDWTVSHLETMGIRNLSLKRNLISITSNKNIRGWEIRLESEKLYYFTIDIMEENKKKTLPIPSGKCSMLIGKM